ncbi:MAG: hypothetical protein ACYC7D_11590 [Nitrososphaerales archaeon]
MTTIEIFKFAKISNIDRINRTLTAKGIDSITGTLRRRTFEYVTELTLERAEKFLVDKTILAIEVDSSTKNIHLRPIETLTPGNDSNKPEIAQTTR